MYSGKFTHCSNFSIRFGIAQLNQGDPLSASENRQELFLNRTLGTVSPDLMFEKKNDLAHIFQNHDRKENIRIKRYLVTSFTIFISQLVTAFHGYIPLMKNYRIPPNL